jgi:deoxyribonuclease V
MSDLTEVSVPDIEGLIFEATCQVPRGMVTTYGDIASALGDVGASRIVGAILSRNPRPIEVPCHRVVYSTGEVGWYCGMGKGTDTKQELLRSEGVPIVDGRVCDLERHRFKDFHIDAALKRLREEQVRLRDLVIEEDLSRTVHKVAGLDVAYRGDTAFAAMAVLDITTGSLEVKVRRSQVLFPYIPSYLSFREMSCLLPLVEGSPDTLFLVDGQGVLHPRGLGIASHLGVVIDVPTIGAAKSLLVGTLDPDDPRSIVYQGRERGRVVGEGRKRLFVSVGHRISLESAERLVAEHCIEPDHSPLLLAHRTAERAKREAGA